MEFLSLKFGFQALRDCDIVELSRDCMKIRARVNPTKWPIVSGSASQMSTPFQTQPTSKLLFYCFKFE